jgi:hypothetical protein
LLASHQSSGIQVSGIQVSLQGAPLPAQYTISTTISALAPCVQVSLQATSTTPVTVSVNLYGPRSPTCLNGGSGYFVTLCSSAGDCHATQDVTALAPHETFIVAVAVTGAQVQAVLNGVVLASSSVAQPPSWTDVDISASGPSGGTAGVDVSDFTIR